jgi:hypothetical protein
MRGEKRDQSSLGRWRSGHNSEEKYRQRQHNEQTDGVFTEAKHCGRESMFLTGFKPMNDGCTAYSYSADRQQFFCPHQHCAKMGAGDMKKGKEQGSPADPLGLVLRRHDDHRDRLQGTHCLKTYMEIMKL